MQTRLLFMILGLGLSSHAIIAAPLGLPPVSVPANNPQTPEKIALGDRLYHDGRARMAKLVVRPAMPARKDLQTTCEYPKDLMASLVRATRLQSSMRPITHHSSGTGVNRIWKASQNSLPSIR